MFDLLAIDYRGDGVYQVFNYVVGEIVGSFFEIILIGLKYKINFLESTLVKHNNV